MYFKFTYNSGHRAPWVRVKVKSGPSSKAKIQALFVRIFYYNKNDDETVPIEQILDVNDEEDQNGSACEDKVDGGETHVKKVSTLIGPR